MTREETLKAAIQAVTQDRENEYGAPEDSFAVIAAMWAVYVKSRCVGGDAPVCIVADDVAIMMCLLKIARITTGEVKADSYVDLAGYAACAAEIATGGRE